MYCKFCGSVVGDQDVFCSKCGGRLNINADPARPTEEPKGETPVHTVIEEPREDAQTEYVKKVLFSIGSSGSYLLAIILFTIATGITFLMNLSIGEITLPIVNIVVIVGFFMFKSAATNSNITAVSSSLKVLRIMAIVNQVIMWVITAIFGFFGLVLFMSSEETKANMLVKIIDFSGADLSGFENYIYKTIFYSDEYASIITVIGFVFLIFAGVFAAFAATMCKTFVTCAREFENLATYGRGQVTTNGAAANWLIFMGVCVIISAFFALSFYSIVVNGCFAVSYFVLAGILKAQN